MILAAVSEETEKVTDKLLGISGGDILFHEVCQELDIPSRIYLVFTKTKYIKAAVSV